MWMDASEPAASCLSGPVRARSLAVARLTARHLKYT